MEEREMVKPREVVEDNPVKNIRRSFENSKEVGGEFLPKLPTTRRDHTTGGGNLIKKKKKHWVQLGGGRGKVPRGEGNDTRRQKINGKEGAQ